MINSLFLIILFFIHVECLNLKNWQLISNEFVSFNKNSNRLKVLSSQHLFNVSVPCTVVSCLIQAKQLPNDLMKSRNLQLVNATMFENSWWFLKTFATPKQMSKHALLVFDGVSYKANLFFNGKQLATSETMQGSFVQHNFDISSLLNRNHIENELLIQVILIIII